MIIKSLTREEWAPFAEAAHVVTFGEKRPGSMERFDFVLVADDDGCPGGWVTCHEMDEETLYWQYGGVLPRHENTIHVYRGYFKMVMWTRERYKKITTKIKADNSVMLRMALKVGFKIVGTTVFSGDIFVELLNEFQGE